MQNKRGSVEIFEQVTTTQDNQQHAETAPKQKGVFSAYEKKNVPRLIPVNKIVSN